LPAPSSEDQFSNFELANLSWTESGQARGLGTGEGKDNVTGGIEEETKP